MSAPAATRRRVRVALRSQPGGECPECDVILTAVDVTHVARLVDRLTREFPAVCHLTPRGIAYTTAPRRVVDWLRAEEPDLWSVSVSTHGYFVRACREQLARQKWKTESAPAEPSPEPPQARWQPYEEHRW